MAKAKKRAFSITKAVKRNARERVGMPRAAFALPTPQQKAARQPRHKETLADLLSKDPNQ